MAAGTEETVTRTGGMESMFGKKGKVRLIFAIAAVSGILAGCSIEETNGTKIKDLEYEIVEEEDVPEELLAIIEEKKAADFKTTYDVEEQRYIVRGYGEQATGGYSIRIKECYLTSNVVLFDTELIGPRKGETTSPNPSYPYIIVRVEKTKEKVVFE